MDRVQAWAFGQAGSYAMGTFANEAMGFHSPVLLSPIRSEVFFHYARAKAEKSYLFVNVCIRGKRNSGTGRHGAAPAPRARSWSSLGTHQPSPTHGQSHRDFK